MPVIEIAPISNDLRTILEQLAEVLFDLQGWITAPGKYAPPGNLPWRAPGAKLSPKEIGAIAVLEDLIKFTTADDARGNYWAPLQANALAHCPVNGMAGWRSQRGLDSQPKFGIAESGNVLLLNKVGLPISRATFYGLCFPQLQAIVSAKPPANSSEWEALRDLLISDTHPSWPAGNWPKSSSFVTQFVSDLLNAMLNMRSMAPSPWKEAVLIELGEGRRVDGKYRPADTDAAVKAFRAALNLP